MNTQVTTRRKSNRNKPQSRPVPEMLLELAYYLHTTKVVGKNRGRVLQSTNRQPASR